MTAADTVHRLTALDDTAQQRLADAYWDDLNAAHPRRRDDNCLEPLLDTYADRRDVDRFGLGMEAGALGSRLRDTADAYDGPADAVATYHCQVQALRDDAPATAHAADVLVADVLPAYMDALGLD